MKKGIYKLDLDFGRMGELRGVFISTDKEVKALIGEDLYFGEVLGKHSDIGGTIEDGDIVLLTDSKEVVDVVEKHELSSGYNPFHYFTCDMCGCTKDPLTKECEDCGGRVEEK